MEIKGNTSGSVSAVEIKPGSAFIYYDEPYMRVENAPHDLRSIQAVNLKTGALIVLAASRLVSPRVATVVLE